MKKYLSLIAISGALLAAEVDYARELRQWQIAREEKLKAPSGWLSLAGLFWLAEGPNKVGSDPQSDVVLPKSAPKHAGVLVRTGETAEWKPTNGPSVKLDEKSDPVSIGSTTLAVIVRSGKVGARLKDPNAETRTHFAGLKWYPPAPKYHFQAKWVPYEKGRTIPIVNILGMTTQEPAPGYIEFAIDGKQYQLEPIVEDDQLFFIFKDQTSTSTTYGAGRYIYTAMPSNGVVDIDFNKAYNPPCAFTAFATCPLPPRQNVLKVAIPAGELRYAQH